LLLILYTHFATGIKFRRQVRVQKQWLITLTPTLSLRERVFLDEY